MQQNIIAFKNIADFLKRPFHLKQLHMLRINNIYSNFKVRTAKFTINMHNNG